MQPLGEGIKQLKKLKRWACSSILPLFNATATWANGTLTEGVRSAR
jgi:hypothetical protein